MSNFERLHPAIQHHVVNSLGWRELRPFQDEVIPSILDGEHAIILAPTAGGKTEAAFLPIASRMLNEGWTGLSVLYLCPIKALLNNLDVRLERYYGLLGRRSTLWHGDVGQSARRRIAREPPDCLLTTPESLEVMLDSMSVDSTRLLSNLRTVIVDEIHAFAGDDRGWHLLSVLARASKIAGRELQRIGLSATVGNPDRLLDWLAGSRPGPRRIFLPTASKTTEADVQLDFVGSLENAAIVISRLHRGEKRLVFVDSRSRAEQLAARLRGLGGTTFVTHGSLGQEQRREAERAFASRDDCVIVATSVLELGVDIGDLDRVIQIDSPSTVSSLLQRMGRTGRRAGTLRNCLLLATDDAGLLQAAGLLELWSTGFVEPVEPPPSPYHVYAQQVMGLILQRRGVARDELDDWLEAPSAFVRMDEETREDVLNWMLNQEILFEDGAILSFGRRGEELFGRKNFLELFSVFLSPPMFTVLFGRQEVGYVDELTFLGKKDGPRTLLLGGRPWLVRHVDWSRKIAHVEPTELLAQSRWKGEGPALGFELCQAVKRTLATDEEFSPWSNRAKARLREIRQDFAWADLDGSAVVNGAKGDVEWWTFGGLAANATLAGGLSSILGEDEITPGNFAIKIGAGRTMDEVAEALSTPREMDPRKMSPAAAPDAGAGLKFSACLPSGLVQDILSARLTNAEGAARLLAETIRFKAIDHS